MKILPFFFSMQEDSVYLTGNTTKENSETIEIEENDHSETSMDSIETERLQEKSSTSNWRETSSVASFNKDLINSTSEKNNEFEFEFEPEVNNVKSKPEDSATANYKDINMADLPKAKNTYENITELTSTMKELVTAEYAIDAKSMDKLKITNNLTIEFKKEYACKIQNESPWSAQIDVNPEFIDKESKGAYSKGYINEVDEVRIKVHETEIEFECKILHINPLTNTIDIIMKLSLLQYSEYKKMECFKFSVAQYGSETLTFTSNEISFIPSDILLKRKKKALRVLEQKVNSQPIMNLLLGKEPVPENGECTSDLSDINLTQNQMNIVKKATTNHVSIIQGPPGTGKTHVISTIVYSILQQHPNERILLCGTSNQSVENLISATAKLVEKLGKKLVWLGSQRTDFTNKESITEEQKYLAYNQMMKRSTFEAKEFQKLHEESLRRPLTRLEMTRISYFRKKLEENISYESNVICCTLEAAGKSSLDMLKFATVIIDEASQAHEPSSFVPLMHHAERLILVGDQKQLRPTIPIDNSFKHTNYNVSLFERSIENGYPIHFLDSQFRMHPDISKFTNMYFYDSKINDAVTPQQRELTTSVIRDHVSFIETNGEEEKVGTSFKNDAEISAVFHMVSELVKDNVSMNDIGIIAPYTMQVKELRKRINDVHPDVKVGSVDSFQGSQKNYIIVSTVRSGREVGFLSDPRRLNVTITRARIAVIIIGNSRTLTNNIYWNKLISYCKNELVSYYKDIDLMIKEAKQHSKYVQCKNKKKASIQEEFPSLCKCVPLPTKNANWLKQKQPEKTTHFVVEKHEEEEEEKKKSAKCSKKNKNKPRGISFLLSYSNRRN